MKTYVELSDGKWIVTEDEIPSQNGEFLLTPLSKGLNSLTQPILTCDCSDVTALWNGSGFLVTLPTTNTTHNFTLTWGNLTRTFQFIVSDRDFSDEIVQLQQEKENQLLIIQDLNNKITAWKNVVIGGENLFHLRNESPGVYYYELNPTFDLPGDIPVSFSYSLIGGPGVQFTSRCPFVWMDNNGNEVIRNFYCIADGPRFLIINQDNETFGRDNLLMYTPAGFYRNSVGNTITIKDGYLPVRLKGEGFIGINLTASIANYSYTELIPVCLTGNKKFKPVGGTASDLNNKIIGTYSVDHNGNNNIVDSNS